jgi:hypothetical protein
LLASRFYGEALESVAARSPDQFITAGLGSIQLWVSDPPPPDVEQVLVQIGRVEAHRVSRNESKWVVITDQPVTFDLLRVSQVQKFLGEQLVESGTYTRVRFSVAGVTVVAAGVEYSARAPGGYISLTRPFRVAEDQTTVLVLDFDGERSLRVTGQGRYILTPEARVLAQEPEHPSKRPGQEIEDIYGFPEGERDRQLREDKPVKRAEVEGNVESLTPDSLVVSGQSIVISPNAHTATRPEPGQKVLVEVTVQSDGSLVATRIEMPEETGRREQSARPEKTGPEVHKGENGPRHPELLEVEIEGEIQEISAGEWVIGGRRVQVSPDTRINRLGTIGDSARIRGIERDDGTILADEIIVISRTDQPNTPNVRESDGRGKGPDGKRPTP